MRTRVTTSIVCALLLAALPACAAIVQQDKMKSCNMAGGQKQF